jgi:recA bacterial DNA recombination protein
MAISVESLPPPGWDPRGIDLLLSAFPAGRLSEIVGPRSSGGSSLLLALLARATAAGRQVALVDAADAFDAASAIASGVELSRLLWVKCGGRLPSALRAADLLARCPGFAVVALDLGEGPLTRDHGVSSSLGLRLQRAVQETSVIMVLRVPHRLTGSAASLVVELRRRQARWIGVPRPTRLAGLDSDARILRSRVGGPLGAWAIEWRL